MKTLTDEELIKLVVKTRLGGFYSGDYDQVLVALEELADLRAWAESEESVIEENAELTE